MENSFQFEIKKKEDYFLVTPTSGDILADSNFALNQVQNWKSEVIGDSLEKFKLVQNGEEIPLAIQ